MRNGRMAMAEERMGKEDGCLARHGIECTEEIDLENTRILRNEYRLRQRKVIERIS